MKKKYNFKIGDQYDTIKLIGISGSLGKHVQYRVYCVKCKHSFTMSARSLEHKIRDKSMCRKCWTIENAFKNRIKHD